MKLFKKLPAALLIALVVMITTPTYIKNAGNIFNKELVNYVEERTASINEVINEANTKEQKENDIGVLHKVNLVRVVDGDTIIVSDDNGDEIRVRLIGIDTPESVNPDESKNTEAGELASEYTKDLLKDVSTVYLEYDEELTDQYDRTLAYVWLNNTDKVFDTDMIEKNMLNAIIVYDGYAIAKEYPPNTMYTGILKILENNAKESKKGLWSI